MGIADMCLRLAMLPENDQEAQKLGNHYHFAGYMDAADRGVCGTPNNLPT